MSNQEKEQNFTEIGSRQVDASERGVNFNIESLNLPAINKMETVAYTYEDDEGFSHDSNYHGSFEDTVVTDGQRLLYPFVGVWQKAARLAGVLTIVAIATALVPVFTVPGLTIMAALKAKAISIASLAATTIILQWMYNKFMDNKELLNAIDAEHAQNGRDEFDIRG